jgi:hypothetical protein
MKISFEIWIWRLCSKAQNWKSRLRRFLYVDIEFDNDRVNFFGECMENRFFLVFSPFFGSGQIVRKVLSVSLFYLKIIFLSNLLHNVFLFWYENLNKILFWNWNVKWKVVFDAVMFKNILNKSLIQSSNRKRNSWYRVSFSTTMKTR